MGEKTVVVRLGMHGLLFWPGLQSQTVLAEPASAADRTATEVSVRIASRRSGLSMAGDPKAIAPPVIQRYFESRNRTMSSSSSSGRSKRAFTA